MNFIPATLSLMTLAAAWLYAPDFWPCWIAGLGGAGWWFVLETLDRVAQARFTYYSHEREGWRHAERMAALPGGDGVVRTFEYRAGGQPPRSVPVMNLAEARERATRSALLQFIDAWESSGDGSLRGMMAAGIVTDHDWRVFTGLLVDIGVAEKDRTGTRLRAGWSATRARLRTAPLPRDVDPPPVVRIPAHTPHHTQETQAGAVGEFV